MASVLNVAVAAVIIGGFVAAAVYIGYLCVWAWRESRAKRRRNR